MDIDQPVDTVSINRDFDLEAYIANYTGHTKINRLLFIAKKCAALKKDALTLALEELKSTRNTTLYRSVAEQLSECHENKDFMIDESWIESVDKKAELDQRRLNEDIRGFRNNLIKESTRIGWTDLGDFEYDRGNLNEAMKAYVRTRDYCTTPHHIISMCLNVIKVSIETSHFPHVHTYVSKAEAAEPKDKFVISKLKFCSGLASLDSGLYKMAAKNFLEATYDVDYQFSDILAPQDIAMFGGLCALATFNRQELKAQVIDNADFKNFLELVPAVRELINDFYTSRYPNCFRYLDSLKPELSLDIFLHKHVENLYRSIRVKALVQYFSPYVSVHLGTMARAFNTDIPGLESELKSLILDSKLDARIDTQHQILYSRRSDQRALTFKKALQMGDEYEKSSRSLLLRINMYKDNFVIGSGIHEGSTII